MGFKGRKKQRSAGGTLVCFSGMAQGWRARRAHALNQAAADRRMGQQLRALLGSRAAAGCWHRTGARSTGAQEAQGQGAGEAGRTPLAAVRARQALRKTLS